MKTIKLNEEQVKFLIGALESEGFGIWDDPSAYGFEEEDFENDPQGVEKKIEAFKYEVCDKVLKQLK